MKNCLLILIILTFAVAVFGQQKTYRDAKNGFSISYPADWEQREPYPPGSSVFGIGKGVTGLTVNAQFLEEFKNKKPAEFVNYISSNPPPIPGFVQQRNVAPPRSTSGGKLFLGKQPAYFIVTEVPYVNIDNFRTDIYYRIFTALNGNVYTLTFHFFKSRYEPDFRLFNSIASTLVIKPTTLPIPTKPPVEADVKNETDVKPGSTSKPFDGGVVNGKAVSMTRPVYPAAAKDAKASGTVQVLVTIDEDGNVISAAAISGHPMLKESAEQAARSSKFKPTIISGQKVKVRGVIVYNFFAP